MVASLAINAGRALLTKVGLNGATISKAGAWLKDALWGNTFSKITTSMSAGSFALKTSRSAASSSGAAQQVRRHAED